MMPGIATMSIFTFIASWNNYLNARIILNTESKYTLPLKLAQLKGSELWNTDQGAVFVGLLVTVLPIILIFIFFSRYLIESIAQGSVKG
jgi:multiple sugar transport system permease protein